MGRTTNGKISKNGLRTIPGIGESIAGDLRDIGICSVADLKGKNPQKLYEACLLYKSPNPRDS